MVLRRLQSLLGRLYDVPFDYDVYDFLVTDRRALAGALPAQRWRAPEEELLLAETADGARVALYIDRGVLERLEQADPFGALTEAESGRLLHGARGSQPFRLFDLAARRGMRRYRCSSWRPRPRSTSTPRRCFWSPISRAAAIRRRCTRGCSTG